MSVVIVRNLVENTTTKLAQGDAYFFTAYFPTLQGAQTIQNDPKVPIHFTERLRQS
jgi:hypothetical protein